MYDGAQTVVRTIQHSSDPQLHFRGPTSKGRERKGMGGEQASFSKAFNVKVGLHHRSVYKSPTVCGSNGNYYHMLTSRHSMA